MELFLVAYLTPFHNQGMGSHATLPSKHCRISASELDKIYWQQAGNRSVVMLQAYQAMTPSSLWILFSDREVHSCCLLRTCLVIHSTSFRQSLRWGRSRLSNSNSIPRPTSSARKPVVPPPPPKWTALSTSLTVYEAKPSSQALCQTACGTGLPLGLCTNLASEGGSHVASNFGSMGESAAGRHCWHTSVAALEVSAMISSCLESQKVLFSLT